MFKDFSKDDALMMVKEAEKLALNEILPTYAEGDKEGCTLKDGKVTIPKCFHQAYKKYCEGGWITQTEPVDVGGQGMPVVMATANLEHCYAANFAFLMYPGLTHGAAGLILNFGTDELKEKYMYKMFSGQWTGTMCLTEPGAGSDVGALKSTAKRLPDGTYSITGTKCFISCRSDRRKTSSIPCWPHRGDPPARPYLDLIVRNIKSQGRSVGRSTTSIRKHRTQDGDQGVGDLHAEFRR